MLLTFEKNQKDKIKLEHIEKILYENDKIVGEFTPESLEKIGFNIDTKIKKTTQKIEIIAFPLIKLISIGLKKKHPTYGYLYLEELGVFGNNKVTNLNFLRNPFIKHIKYNNRVVSYDKLFDIFSNSTLDTIYIDYNRHQREPLYSISLYKKVNENEIEIVKYKLVSVIKDQVETLKKELKNEIPRGLEDYYYIIPEIFPCYNMLIYSRIDKEPWEY